MSTWKISYNEYKPEEQKLHETLCALGNGYFVTRAAAAESSANEIHYPGTYLGGGYNRLKSEVSGRIIENEDLVNWPNLLPLSFRFQGGDWFSLDKVEIEHYSKELDLKKGLLSREVIFTDNKGRKSKLFSRRFVSMQDSHLAGIIWELTPLNWNGRIHIRSGIDGSVKNWGVERYRDLSSRHLVNISTGVTEEGIVHLSCETLQSKIRMAQAVRTRLALTAKAIKAEETGFKVFQEFEVDCKKNHPVTVEKMAALFTSRDFAISEPLEEAILKLQRVDSFEEEFINHCRSWSHLWDRCDIEVEGDDETQLILRLHIFHLLQTVSFNSIDKDAGVPARGWHGEAYRGHIFWDELFIFPFLNLRLPELTRELLMYRYRRLSEARFAAKEAGYKGAMFPWQSGSNGREESQVLHLNPESGNWLPDNTFLQRHLNSAIAYNTIQYVQANNDQEFSDFHAAEMTLEIARFWASIAEWNPKKNRYDINGVVGPDEYHTAYPGSDAPGINNNAYTNIMATWVLWHALELQKKIDEERLNELYQNLGIEEEETKKWDHISRNMFVPLSDEGIIWQFEGYDQLEEFPWEEYQEKHGDSMRLDRILEKEGKDINKYKASKQADVLMLFYLFEEHEIILIFKRLGYYFTREQITHNIKYYEQRTSHGSTLSQLVHSWIMARCDGKQSWHRFNKALISDFKDVQGGTTPEGIHLGAMAGTVDLIQRCYTGIFVCENELHFAPQLPRDLESIKFKIRFRGNWICLNLTHGQLELKLNKGLEDSQKVKVFDKEHILKTGETNKFDIPEKPNC